MFSTLAAPSHLNMDTVSENPTQPPSPGLQEDLCQLEESMHRFAVGQRTDVAVASQRSYGNFSLPSFHEVHEASVGKFTATTATFSWPSLRPSSKLEEPHMYWNPEKPSTSSSPSSCASPAPIPCCTTPISKAGSLKRPRSKHEYEADEKDFEMPLGNMRIIRTRKELFDGDNSSRSYTSNHTPFYSPPSTSQQTSGPLRKSSRPGIATASSSTTAPHVATSSCSSGHSGDHLQAPRGGRLPMRWERYAVYFGSQDFFCRWEGCSYKGNRQLVKRHVETKHMGLRRFPQKTSLNVHIASRQSIITSTRDNPYKCPFNGCLKAYNDPARLHRHKVDVHNAGQRCLHDRALREGPYQLLRLCNPIYVFLLIQYGLN
ncbi:hypothetical protein J3R30DRAFT_3404187 [Lentinula aciculospora]|uniref:C2H2-type domain-containing protein n=1 Tax=Lentinula aciculospora TaxID=153920 RepID=A0A9W9DNZ8_9AGAR|nr:hypothetical protein J3R30DRAFT_3404187 [Lentinula aciculospora]